MADSEEEQTTGGPKRDGGVEVESVHNTPPNRSSEAEGVEMGETEEAQKED